MRVFLLSLLFLPFAVLSQNIDVWNGGSSEWTVTDDNDGSCYEKPILITSALQFAFMSENVSKCNSLFFRLTVNLDLNSILWRPIGDNKSRFKGYFDGGGCAVYNLLVDERSDYVGLFGYAEGGRIENLFLDGSCSVRGVKYVGAILGSAENVDIINCGNSGSIVGEQYMGGIIGALSGSGSVKMCYNAGRIVSSVRRIGGIVGSTLGGGIRIEKSFNIGSIVSGGEDTGGVVGNLNTSGIDCCYNMGAILLDGNSGNVGGVVGYANGSNVSNCYNAGSINFEKRPNNMGAVVGHVLSATVSNCYYDEQQCAVVDGIGTLGWSDNTVKVSTINMIGDGLKSLLGSEGWVFEGGMYPRLVGVADSDAARVGSVAVLLANDEKSNGVKSMFVVGSPNGMAWESSNSSIVMVDDNGRVRLTKAFVKKEVILSLSKEDVRRDIYLIIAPTDGYVVNDHLVISSVEERDVLAISDVGSVTIKAGGSLTVNAISSLRAESLVIENSREASAVLVIKDQNSAMPLLTVSQEMTTGLYYIEDFRYQIIATPTSTIPIKRVRETFSGAYLDRYNQLNGRWERFDGAGFDFEKFRGYVVNFNSVDKAVLLKGQIDNRDVTYELDYDRNIINNSDYGGLNLIGNPYTAAIDVTKFEWSSSFDFDKTVYVWSPTLRQYLTYPANIDPELYGDLIYPYIPSCQGFWVRVIPTDSELHKSANIVVPYSAIKKECSQPLYKTDNEGEKVYIKLEVENESGGKDGLILIEDTVFSSGFDNGYDALKWRSLADVPSLFANEEDMELAVNCKPNISETNIGFVPCSKSGYTMRVVKKSGIEEILLYDELSGKVVDITNDSYAFKSDIYRKFKLLVNKSDGKGVMIVSENNINIRGSGRRINVFLPKLCGNATVSILDCEGKLLKEQFLTDISNCIDVDVSGFYLIKVVNGSELLTKKLILH